MFGLSPRPSEMQTVLHRLLRPSKLTAKLNTPAGWPRFRCPTSEMEVGVDKVQRVSICWSASVKTTHQNYSVECVLRN